MVKFLSSNKYSRVIGNNSNIYKKWEYMVFFWNSIYPCCQDRNFYFSNREFSLTITLNNYIQPQWR